VRGPKLIAHSPHVAVTSSGSHLIADQPPGSTRSARGETRQVVGPAIALLSAPVGEASPTAELPLACATAPTTFFAAGVTGAGAIGAIGAGAGEALGTTAETGERIGVVAVVAVLVGDVTATATASASATGVRSVTAVVATVGDDGVDFNAAAASPFGPDPEPGDVTQWEGDAGGVVNIRSEAKLGLFGDEAAGSVASSFILVGFATAAAAGAGGPSEGNFIRGDFVTGSGDAGT
jgi:hypothetical protein